MSTDRRDTTRLDAVEAAAQALEDVQDRFRRTILAARDAGFRNTEIAPRAHLTPQRIGQIMAALGHGPERAFWDPDDGMVVVAVGEKTEAPKPASGPLGPVVTTEAREAYEILSRVLSGQGLDAEYEPVAADDGGYVNLNRRGLVVVCGPRLSPLLAQVLESDPVLGFGHDAAGWYLQDRRQDKVYRSPLDDGVFADYGYLGRLPRPDGKGYFLYLGGIHAAGLAGAALYLEQHLTELWEQVRTGRFSLLVRCNFTKDRHVTTVELVAGPYVHEQ